MPTVEEIQDVDVYGRTATGGGGLLQEGDFAVSNAIVLYLNSTKGDYLYDPTFGGPIQSLPFKNITAERMTTIIRDTERDLETNFGAFITNVDVQITADYDNRLVDIEVLYDSLRTGKTNQVLFTVGESKKPSDPENDKYTSVKYEGDNLIAFVTLQKSSFPNNRLQYDSSVEAWVWGEFLFTNLTVDSPEFEDVQAITEE